MTDQAATIRELREQVQALVSELREASYYDHSEHSSRTLEVCDRSRCKRRSLLLALSPAAVTE